ncbi:MAG: tetratricopeptide repeat protein [Desulfovibrionaceae bacterium]|nr:tetratricopeptide repeat protein [Desulfovibrionaceae bacterium]
MALWKSFKHSLRSLLGKEDELFLTWNEGESASERDTLSAIRALSQEVRNDPDGVETYLALGNLYRSRGDIERAIQIRNGLIVRPGLDNNMKARIYFELGLDYKRSGLLDRAFKALEEALAYGGPDDVIRQEIAMLYADSRNYLMAARAYGKLGHKVAESYYLTLISEELFARPDFAEALSFAKRAIRVSPKSPEAWLMRVKSAALNVSGKDLQKTLRHAFLNIPPEHQFMLLEGLLKFIDDTPENLPESVSRDMTAWRSELAGHIAAAVPEASLDPLNNYYKGLMLMRFGKSHEAGTYFEKSVIADPDFWAAHLELLGISFAHQNTSPMFNEQIRYFLKEGRNARQFVCSSCGFAMPGLFFVCPRCRSWHSALFRRKLNN